MNMRPLYIFCFLLSLVTHFPSHAEAVRQKELNFTVKGEELLKGHVAWSIELFKRGDLKSDHPEFADFDTSGFTRADDARLLASKSAYVVNKPVGFFDHDKIVNLKFLNHFLGQQKVTQMGEGLFKVEIPGSTPLTYKMRTHFDSDDISSTKDSRVIRAITAAKRMDIQVQGASSIYVREMWDYSRGAYGAIHVTACIAIMENRTLIIDYGIMSLKPPLMADETLIDSVRDEATAHQTLINSFP